MNANFLGRFSRDFSEDLSCFSRIFDFDLAFLLIVAPCWDKPQDGSTLCRLLSHQSSELESTQKPLSVASSCIILMCKPDHTDPHTTFLLHLPIQRRSPCSRAFLLILVTSKFTCHISFEENWFTK